MENTTNTTTKRNFKDGVFRMLLNIPENALAVYNGLNGTNYTDTNQLTYNTLDNAIYMNIKNDVSFIIGLDMPLYEHQSTFTPNMPLRDLLYVADLLQVYVKDESIYSTRLITVPTPWFVVFYNGSENFPDKKILRLSDSFEHPVEHPQLELIVTILNINSGHNTELKKCCSVLNEYSIFVETTRKYSKILPIEEAVKRAVEECIQNNVLRDFLLRQKAEVIKMSIYEFDAEREWALIRRDERILAKEELREEVIQEVRKEVAQEVRKEVAQEVRKEVAQEVRKEVAQEVRQEVIQEITEQLQESAQKTADTSKLLIQILQTQGKTKEEVIQLLQTHVSLSFEEATSQVDLYWKE